MERGKRSCLFLKYKLEIKCSLPVLLYRYSLLYIPNFILLTVFVKAQLDGISEGFGYFIRKCLTAWTFPLLIKLQKHCILFKGLYLTLKGQGPEQT